MLFQNSKTFVSFVFSWLIYVVGGECGEHLPSFVVMHQFKTNAYPTSVTRNGFNRNRGLCPKKRAGLL